VYYILDNYIFIRN